MVAKRLSQPPVIDGDVTDAVWQELEVSGQFYDPAKGKIAEEDTEVRIGYDDKAIYLAWVCHDSKPDQISAKEITPGASLEGDDFVGLWLEPYFTRQAQPSVFRVNARGNRNEVIAGGRAGKREWIGDWQSAAKVVSDGWRVEMRIPWEMVDYPRKSGPINMTVNFVRRNLRLNNRTYWSNIGLQGLPEYDGIWEGVQPPVSQKKDKPLLLAYNSGEAERKQVSAKMGLDIKQKLRNDLTAVGTLFPDFENIEQQIENSTFTHAERFYGDARPFFAEGADRLNLTSQYGIGRLFYSRRIGQIDAGAKVYGRLDSKTPVGAFVVAGKQGEYDGAFQIERQEGSTLSTAAFGTISHTHAGNELVVGSTLSKRMGNYTATGDVALLDNDGTKTGSYSASLDYSVPKIFSTTRYTSSPKNFNPRLALLNKIDAYGAYNFTQYETELPKGRIQYVHADVSVDDFKHFNGSNYQKGIDGSFGIQTRDQQNFSISRESRRYDTAYDNVTTVNYHFHPNDRFNQFGIGHAWGERQGSKYALTRAVMSRRVLKKIDAGLQYTVQDFNGKYEQYVFTGSYEIDDHRSISARAVRTGDKWNPYIAYRNSGKKGNELYVIFGDPNADSFKSRLVVKYVMPLG